MESFTKLTAWKEGLSLVKQIYKLTKEFPPDERFGLTSQLRRASTSITANLAEGFSRVTPADKKYRYIICRSECTETQAHLLVSLELSLGKPEEIHRAIEQCHIVGKLLSGLIYSQERKTYIP